MSDSMWGDKEHAAGNKARFMEKERQRKWDHAHSGNEKNSKGSGQGTGHSGIGCLVVAAGIGLLIFLVMFVMTVGVGFNAISNFDTAQSFGFAQYVRNIIHLDQSALFEVGPVPLACYKSATGLQEADTSKPMFILKSGQKFVYRGCASKGDATCVAVQLWQQDVPVYGYLLVAQEWNGNSFWGHKEIEEVLEVDMLGLRAKALKDLPQLILQEFAVLEISRKDVKPYYNSDDYVNMSSLIAPQSDNYMAREKRQTFYFLTKEDFKQYVKFKKRLKDEQRIWQIEAQLP